MARKRTRASAASSAACSVIPKRLCICSSWAKACTVRIADIPSSASADSPPSFSCAWREEARNRRANIISGITTIGTITATTSDIRAEASTTKTSPPNSKITFRTAMDRVVARVVCTTAVSAFRRERMSPVRAASNQPVGKYST